MIFTSSRLPRALTSPAIASASVRRIGRVYLVRTGLLDVTEHEYLLVEDLGNVDDVVRLKRAILPLVTAEQQFSELHPDELVAPNDVCQIAVRLGREPLGEEERIEQCVALSRPELPDPLLIHLAEHVHPSLRGLHDEDSRLGGAEETSRAWC